jgi:hypothetical protein
MRTLMTVEFDTEKANKLIAENALGDLMMKTMDQLHPESAVFGAKDGKRTGYIVFDLADPTDIPRIAEPFFMALNAKIEFIPVMDAADVQTGLAKYAASR